MSKINMRLLKDGIKIYDAKNIECTINKNDDSKTIEFNFENISNKFEVYDYGCIFKRENTEFEFKLDTIKRNSTYYLKETDTLLDICVEKCDFEKNGSRFKIKYQLETDDSVNTIEIWEGDLF